MATKTTLLARFSLAGGLGFVLMINAKGEGVVVMEWIGVWGARGWEKMRVDIGWFNNKLVVWWIKLEFWWFGKMVGPKIIHLDIHVDGIMILIYSSQN